MIGLLGLFGLLLLSNLSAFIYIIWLEPNFVFFEVAVWLAFAAVSAWVLYKRRLLPAFFEHFRKHWSILPFLIFSGITIFWSVYWEISLARWIILLFTVIAGGYIGLRYDIKDLVKYVSIFSACILLLSIGLVLFAPKIGVMNYYSIQGAWRGVYWHKNHLGLMVVFGNTLFLMSALSSLRSKEKQTWLWGALYLISMLVVYKSDSVASYITAIFLHGLIFLSLALLKYGRLIRVGHYVILFGVLILSSFILFSNIDRFFSIFDRNTTLTGRIPMWDHLFNTYFSQRPVGGYGFNAFWYIESHRVELHQVAGYPDPIVIADNGFIDIAINTGYIGLALFLVFYLDAWRRSIQYGLQATDILGLFPVILMAYTLLANISWSLIFENEGFFMLVMISMLFAISAQNSGSPAGGPDPGK